MMVSRDPMDDLVCRCCDQEYTLRRDHEPTGLCDDCAQMLVPAMLEGCKAARSLLQMLGAENYDPEYSELCAAIAKAEGHP